MNALLRRAAGGLAALASAALALPALAQSQSTCEAWLATDPSPAGIPAVSGPGVTQRANFLAAGGKLVAIGSRYYAVYIPTAFYTAPVKVVVLDLHGTGGYAEAEWTDWHTTMAAKGHAFIALSWGGGTPGAATDTQIYSQVKQIFTDVGAQCPISSARKYLMGFSVGSAYSFAVMIRDVADAKLFRGQVAISGSAIGPLTTGIAQMHATVESNRSNAAAVSGTKSWMYCGHMDMDHGWDMCTEMPYGLAFVNEHGGLGTLYQDPLGTHHALPSTPAAYDAMYAFLVASDSADLAMAQSASPPAGSTGKDLVFTGTVTNNGMSSAPNVTVTNTIPAGNTYIWASPGCAYASGTVTCSVGTLATFASASVKVVVRPNVAGTVSNTMTAATSATDGNAADNTATATVSVSTSAVAAQAQRYRLYSPVTNEHLYTTDLNEYNVLGALVGTWTQEGTVGKVLNNPGTFGGVAATPYYRLYNTSNLQHHWTTDPNEYYTLVLFPQYSGEGVDGYILPTAATGTVPLYRLLYPFTVPVAGLHHWTIDSAEYNALIASFGWVGEGGSGYVIP